MKQKKQMIVKLRELLRLVALNLKHVYLVKIYGMQISPSARISWGAKLDKSNPHGIIIKDEVYVASGALILSHDFCRDIKCTTIINTRCFIGANAIIMPGINIGEEVIVGSGAVVTKDVPSNCIIVGNPAKVIKTGISTKKWGKLIPDD